MTPVTHRDDGIDYEPAPLAMANVIRLESHRERARRNEHDARMERIRDERRGQAGLYGDGPDEAA